MRKLLILLLLSIPVAAQIPGYSVPRSGIGLTVCIGSGSNTLSGSVVNYAGSCLGPFGLNATTFGYVDSATGNVLTNTTGAPANSCPIFEADTNSFQVTAVRDKRPSFCSSAGTGTVGANNGSAGAIAIYAAAGGSTAVSADATLNDSGTTLAYTGTQIGIGPHPAAAGALRLSNNTSLSFRNAANSADVRALLIDASNVINIGSGGNPAAALNIANSTGNVIVIPSGSNAIQLAGNIAFTTGKGQHFDPQAANSDTAGVCSGTTTTCAVAFTSSYASTPSCVLTPTTAGVTSFIITTQSNTGFTVTYAPTGTTTFNYVCIGNPS